MEWLEDNVETVEFLAVVCETGEEPAAVKQVFKALHAEGVAVLVAPRYRPWYLEAKR